MDKRLHEAAINGDIKQLKALLSGGWLRKPADINGEIAFGYTPLLLAAMTKQQAVVLFLVDHGADVNAKALLAGHTALHYAAGHGDLPMVLGLLAKGADANAKRQDGVSVLLESACGGFGDYDGERDYVGVIKALLAHGADVNASRAKDGLTPLHGAARAADEASVRLLISSGADVNAKDTNGLTALDYANERANGAGERLLPRIRPIQELLRELR